MTIEPSDNPHVIIGKLTQMNEALRQQQQRLDDDLQFVRGQLLGCREANKVLEDKNKELEKLLAEERHAYARLKHLRHRDNYGIDAQQFAKIILEKSSDEQTATEILEVQNLKREREQLQAHLEKRIKELVEEHKIRNMAEARCTELAKLHDTAIAQSVKFANELIAERAAHNKLKALCHERGFGTPPFYAPPKLPSPKWVVCFYRDGLELGTITYTHAPSTSALNMLQESLKASSWRLTYHHD